MKSEDDVNGPLPVPVPHYLSGPSSGPCGLGCNGRAPQPVTGANQGQAGCDHVGLFASLRLGDRRGSLGDLCCCLLRGIRVCMLIFLTSKMYRLAEYLSCQIPGFVVELLGLASVIICSLC